MTDEHIEPDRKPSDEEFSQIMDCEVATAHSILDELLPVFDEVDNNHGGYGNLAYSLWVALTRYLAENGYEADELARDAGYHAAHQTSEGSA